MKLKFAGLLLLLINSVTYASGGGGGGDANNPYFDITTPFVVNIQSENGMNYLQVQAQLRLSNPELKSKLSANLPAIQHTMMMLLSEQNAKDLRSVAGKQKLRETVLKELQKLLEKEIGEPAVEEVLFAGFIIQ